MFAMVVAKGKGGSWPEAKKAGRRREEGEMNSSVMFDVVGLESHS